MQERKNFRLNLYKLMLVRNIIENKVHKEKMSMLYAFEQLIINTEDEHDLHYLDEEGQLEEGEGDGQDMFGQGDHRYFMYNNGGLPTDDPYYQEQLMLL